MKSKKIRILYIPTGEFLCSGVNNPGNVFWTIGIEVSLEHIVNDILSMNNNSSLFSLWRKNNNIQLPISIEELEVIYD